MSRNKFESVAQEIAEHLVYVGRCAKVVKGGRKFSFAAIVVAGDKRGRVGVGLGKAPEVVSAKEKASKEARRRMVKVPLRDGRTLHHDITAEFCSARIVLRPAPAGTGIIAGGAVRAVLEALGVKDVVAKAIGSTNPHNIVRAAMLALQQTASPRHIAEKRGKKVFEIAGRRDRHARDSHEVMQQAVAQV